MDIGEQSYSMVLADDLDNNGHMDLLVSTMNGNVYALETSAVYHPMKAWTSVARHARSPHSLPTVLSILPNDDLHCFRSILPEPHFCFCTCCMPCAMFDALWWGDVLTCVRSVQNTKLLTHDSPGNPPRFAIRRSEVTWCRCME